MVRNPNKFAQRSLISEMPMNVARTPTAWLSKQDEFTGMELIRAAKQLGVAKSHAFRIIAKAYNPLFFLLAGSDRAASPDKMPNIISTLDLQVLRDHIQAFLLTIIIVVVGVTMLMNHMLASDVPEDMAESPKDDGPLLKCQTNRHQDSPWRRGKHGHI